ncbi:MAG: hypothetical protein ACXVB0_07600 [Mucilaginibacter sp.]
MRNTLGEDKVVLGDYLELPEILLRSGKVISLPDPHSFSYTHQMLALCLDREINVIYALRELEIQLLSGTEQLFYEYDIKIIKASDDKIS